MLDKENTENITPKDVASAGKVLMKLVTPLFPVETIEADSILLPAVDGDILILPERAPIFFNLRAGRLTVFNKGQEPVHYLVSPGICETRRNVCSVLAWGGRENHINPEIMAHHLATALAAMPQADSAVERSQVAARIEFFEFVLKELHYDKEISPLKGKKGALKLTPEDFGVQKA